MASSMPQKLKSKARRSRNGCETCRRRKVKCDELHPSCSECHRLELTCGWAQGKRPSVKDVRRGTGPVKSRQAGWTPRTIAPQIKAHAGFTRSTSRSRTPVASPWPADWNDLTLTSDELFTEDFTEDLISNCSQSTTLSSSEGLFDEEDSADASSCPTHLQHQSLFLDNILLNEGVDQQIQDIFLDNSLSNFHMALPNALVLSIREHEALRHYQTTYSLYRTTKDPNWSTHKVLLHMATSDAMIMHLLLAVSLNDYSIRSGQSSPPWEAEEHFGLGTRLLINASSSLFKPDEVVMLAAYFFIYLYMSKRRSTNPRRLNQLSLTVLQFVRKKNLIAHCLGPHPPPEQHGTLSGPAQNRSLLSRMIMWTLDEDVKCSFQGIGGHVASYFAKRGVKTKEIYDTSRNALGDHWGSEYPHSQVLDDDQNSTVLEFLWVLMPLWQDINDLQRQPDPSASRTRIEQTFSVLEKRYSSVFRHSSETTKPRPRILVNADFDVVLFNALKVYYFRSTMSDLAMQTPSEILICLKTILTIIQRTFSSRGTELHDRLQWPLFLAGIETNDSIYREWIFSRLTSDRVSVALQQTIDAQDHVGHRLSIMELRQLLYNGIDADNVENQSAHSLDVMIN